MIDLQLQHDLGAFTLDASFRAPNGVTALFGRSGSGKSTIIQIIAGLMVPRSGCVQIGDRVVFDQTQNINIPPQDRGIGYVFQDARLFPHLSVAGNLTYAQNYGRRGQADLGPIVDMLDIGHLLKRRPAGLSGGEIQRVAIARALLSSPSLLLMDEPLAALDAARKAEILPYLERLRDTVGIPIIYVSHDPSEVARLANTVVVLDQGRVQNVGPTEDIFSDTNTAPLLGVRAAGSVLTAQVVAHCDDGLSHLKTSGAELFVPRVSRNIGQDIRMRILAQDVILSLHKPEGISALNVLKCTVIELRQGSGPGVMVKLQNGTDILLARITQRSAQAMKLTCGSTCYAVIKTVSVGAAEIGT